MGDERAIRKTGREARADIRYRAIPPAHDPDVLNIRHPDSTFRFEFTPLGDSALTITVGTTIDETNRRLVRAISAHLDAHPLPGMQDQVPAFVSVAVHYDPSTVGESGDESPHERMVMLLDRALAEDEPELLPPPREVRVPVCYGGELGPDLEDVARVHALAPDDVIRLHTAADYVVHMVGFMPGFAYLGGLPEELITPRRSTPRTAVPAGTVGIGGQQTGVYPLESPGGWNLIGRTPLRIFDIERSEPTLLATGDRVRFHPIDRAEYDAWPVNG